MEAVRAALTAAAAGAADAAAALGVEAWGCARPASRAPRTSPTARSPSAGPPSLHSPHAPCGLLVRWGRYVEKTKVKFLLGGAPEHLAAGPLPLEVPPRLSENGARLA